jgi:hypothetical protein
MIWQMANNVWLAFKRGYLEAILSKNTLGLLGINSTIGILEFSIFRLTINIQTHMHTAFRTMCKP